MTQIRNKILVSAFVLLGTSQAFAMGAKRPASSITASRISTIVSSLGQTQSAPQSSSNYLGQILGSVLPLITASSSLSSSIGVFTNVVIPLVNSIRQSSAAVPNGQGSVYSSAYLEQIESLAQDSVCFQGQVPADFLAKISLNYARGICQLKAKSKTVLFISTIGLDKILQKALSSYQPKLVGFVPLESSALTSVPVCNQLLNNVQELISNDPYACQDI